MRQKRFAIAAALAAALVAVPAGATADQPIKTITAGAGLTGGGTGPSVTLAVANGGITNAMLANPMLSILPGTGLVGGGPVALGGSTSLGIGTGAVDTAQLAAGAVTPAKMSASGSSAGQVLSSDGTNVSWQSLPSPNAWSLNGNAGTTPGTNFLGTTDNTPLDLKVNGSRALGLEPGKDAAIASPNVIGGFSGNSVGAGVSGATIGGGGAGIGAGGACAISCRNSVSANYGTIGGGAQNSASGLAATIAGGGSNTASAVDSTVGGGIGNTASGDGATVTGGDTNTASGFRATVAGGDQNTASGVFSFAAGGRAQATHNGSFVWADDHLFRFGSTADNEFSARATGGVRFVSAIDTNTGAPTAGVSLAPGSGSWSSLSDRNLKRNFAHVDGAWVLERLAGLPISSWSYKAQKPSIRHLGPTAQDFALAFGLGEDNRHIDTIDSEGVSLAGIKALYQLAQKQQREIAALKARVAKLERSRARTEGGR